jgi:hypothetical protein
MSDVYHQRIPFHSFQYRGHIFPHSVQILLRLSAAKIPLAADLKFLHRLPERSFRKLQIGSGARNAVQRERGLNSGGSGCFYSSRVRL